MDTPKHIAIIPDGNRRWARERNLPVIEGHRKGAEVVLKLIKKAKKLDIKILSFWAFSTENWERMKKEVSGLMRLFEQAINANLNNIIKNKIRFIHIGRKDRLSTSLRKTITTAQEESKDFNQHYFVLALDYGGRDEILRAINKLRENFKFQISNFKLDEEGFKQFLDTKDLPYPDPDLVIRTSSEMRTSGFMIWQAAYAEWIFHPKYFPDFTPEDFEECIKEYQKRQRRFGK
jgi:undecaprenyl diphosphate synthase